MLAARTPDDHEERPRRAQKRTNLAWIASRRAAHCIGFRGSGALMREDADGGFPGGRGGRAGAGACRAAAGGGTGGSAATSGGSSGGGTTGGPEPARTADHFTSSHL
jgi:hypothetical protein